MMVATNIPELSEQEIQDFLKLADGSKRRRHPKLLHSPGDEFNCVFNFMMQDSYMQPHLHPGKEKIEKIYLIRGKVAILFFNDQGEIEKCTLLEKGGVELIEVPAFTWHTYVILTDYAVTYETMMGVYRPYTWKKASSWAPLENTKDASIYLKRLLSEVTSLT
jgi:cupin fold WbuC family metalloprotein